MEIMEFFDSIYNNKTVLVTGHTGFKGSWLSIWLNELGAKVVGYSLDPYSDKDNFVLSNLCDKIVDIRGDIRDTKHLAQIFSKYKPEFVFHLAAQPLVIESYNNPLYTYETNVIGTINVLQEIRKCDDTKVAIMVTTDKCYDNKEQLWGYREKDALGGYDPYSSSKAAAEMAINSWRLSFMNPNDHIRHGKSISSVRAGNVIGGGDWSKDRIIPDCMRAIENDRQIEIRSPRSVRPWQHVLEPLSGYLLLGAKMRKNPTKYCEAWNFGPYISSVISVWDISNKIVDYYGFGRLIDVSEKNSVHEAKLLALDISKARFKLGWTPSLTIDETIQLTADWYKKYNYEDVYKLCVKQIDLFCKMSL